MTFKIKLNATGRHTLLSVVPENTELYDKITGHGIMEPIEFTYIEVAALRAFCEHIGSGTNTDWANTRLRIATVFREMSDMEE